MNGWIALTALGENKMLRRLQEKYPRVAGAWLAFTNITTVSAIALFVSFGLVSLYSEEGPVVETSDLQLHTPVVEVGGVLSYSLWRKSFESCPGEVVSAYFPSDQADDREVQTLRRPLSTPGFQSPPRLPINSQLPKRISPGKYKVRVGIESHCPNRKRFDIVAEFEIEVVNAKSNS